MTLTPETLLGIAALLVLAIAVPYDGARDGGRHALRMRPHMRLPWPLIDPAHLDKYLSIYPLWLFPLAVALYAFGWKILPGIGLLAVWCAWGWDRMAGRRLKSLGQRADWPTAWSKLLRLLGRKP